MACVGGREKRSGEIGAPTRQAARGQYWRPAIGVGLNDRSGIRRN
jgi:hypothetical protein